MTDANEMRVQEVRIRSELARLRRMLRSYSGAPDALSLAVQMTRMVGAWRRIIVARERFVYQPRLASPSEADALIARTCQERMMTTARRVRNFAWNWSSSALIASDFDRFRYQATALMVAIEAHFDCDRSLLGVDDGARRIAA